MTTPKTPADNAREVSTPTKDLARLRFPGSVPGVLRRGSPVFHIDGSPYVVLEMDGSDIRLHAGWAPSYNIDLDLTDATGRAHLAWWVDARSQFGRVWYIRDLRFHMTGPDFILSTLDPNDPRLLPDGSRWVDAEALSLVARHVAGLEADHA